jgi:hypothetical protein
MQPRDGHRYFVLVPRAARDAVADDRPARRLALERLDAVAGICAV